MEMYTTGAPPRSKGACEAGIVPESKSCWRAVGLRWMYFAAAVLLNHLLLYQEADSRICSLIAIATDRELIDSHLTNKFV